MKASERLKAASANISASIGGARGSNALLPTAIGADMYAGTGRLKGAMLLPVDRVFPDPDQPRQEFDPDELQRLASSLKDRGQLQPIRVRIDAEAQRWIIIAGERRWRAAQLAGLAHVSAVEVSGSIDSDAILEDQLVENCLRADLRPIEQARAFRSLMDRKGFNQLQLSQRLSLSPAAVSHALSLLTLPESVQASVEQGTLAPTAAALLTKLGSPEQQEKLAAEAVEAGLTRGELKEAVAGQVGRKRGRPAKPQPRRETISMDGFTVVVIAADPDVTDAGIEQALKRAAARFKQMRQAVA